MKNKNISKIIANFLENRATPEDIKKLTKWAKRNPSSYKDYVEVHYLLTRDMDNGKTETFKKELLSKLNNLKEPKKKHKITWFKYAAIFVGVLACASYLFLQTSDIDKSVNNDVTITFNNGAKEILNEKNSSLISNSDKYIAKQEGTKITYNKQEIDKNDSTEPLVYNTVNVPYGKKFEVVLSDGTEVFLNSGSTFTYPIAFYSKGERKVVLTGEAYFSVKSDSLRPFIVKSKELKTKVLGTQFNFSCYPDDEIAHVVLVEGRVAVKELGKPESSFVFLKPNQKVCYSNSKKGLEIKNVDVSKYVSWKEGVLFFKNEDFFHITKKLERHYSVKIEIKEGSLKTGKFTGRFKTESIEEVLEGFQRIKKFEYTLKDQKIILTQKSK